MLLCSRGGRKRKFRLFKIRKGPRLEQARKPSLSVAIPPSTICPLPFSVLISIRAGRSRVYYAFRVALAKLFALSNWNLIFPDSHRKNPSFNWCLILNRRKKNSVTPIAQLTFGTAHSLYVRTIPWTMYLCNASNAPYY